MSDKDCCIVLQHCTRRVKRGAKLLHRWLRQTRIAALYCSIVLQHCTRGVMLNCCTVAQVRQGLLDCVASLHKAYDAQLLHMGTCQTRIAGLYCSIAQGVSSVMPNYCTGAHVRQGLLDCIAALHKMFGTRLWHRCLCQRHWLVTKVQTGFQDVSIRL